MKSPELYQKYSISSKLDEWVSIDGKDSIKPDKVKGMTDMLSRCGLKLEGRHHSGIDDARNIAKVAQYLVKNGFKFTHTMVYHSKK